MADAPIQLTDPARELVELCAALSTGQTNAAGDAFLSQHFGVQAWTNDFYRIIMAISDRIEVVRKLVEELELDADFRLEMLAHIDAIRSAFSQTAFSNAWSSFGLQRLSAENVQPLKALSGMIRPRLGYRKLSEEDVDEIGTQAAQLQEWLAEKNLVEHDFIRGLLIEALQSFRFRLEHFQWVGIGYTLEGLREVLSAYFALERAGIDPKVDPNAEAILKKVASLIRLAFGKVQVVKDVADTGDWLLKAYGAASAIYHGAPLVAGLLSAP